MSGPVLLRGAAAIAERLRMSPATVAHMHRQGTLPTFRAGGTPYATASALDEWRELFVADRLPRR